jgi:hypothetical protein
VERAREKRQEKASKRARLIVKPRGDDDEAA